MQSSNENDLDMCTVKSIIENNLSFIFILKLF